MIVAALAWFDENPDLLGAAILSAADAGVEAVVALDGAYAAYPSPRAVSPDEQLAAIVKTSRSSGLTLTVSQPATPWASEVEKRSALFRLADAMIDDDGWVFVMDADYQIRTARPLPSLLDGAEERAAEATLWTPPNPERTQLWKVAEWTTIRCLFRGRGITVGPTNHYTYTAPDGAVLWGHETDVAPALDLTAHVRVDHLAFHRPEGRVETQKAYYLERDALGLERGPCQRCRAFRSVGWMPTNITAGKEAEEFDWLEVCAACVREVAAENSERAVTLGLDVETVTRPFHLVRGALAEPPVPV